MPTAPAIRAERQQAILDIIAAQPVARQSELVALLRARGVAATQSSISRDLRELGVAKLESGYGRLAAGTAAGLEALPSDLMRGFEPAGEHLTVIKTATGAAARVALFLDRSDWPEIVGTVSGDDTIFVATRNGTEQRRLLARLRASEQHD
ncbi:MAG: hypothetical protein V2J12_10390 [Gammaproteobacteria bacterium]|jgi:transcriptional regulator of arginine metabolism|nr:hypothetical protein [Gammaproteobacteria bacterium]